MDSKGESFISRLFVQSSHYAIGTMIVFMAGFISFPILTRLLSRSEYGVLSLVSVTLFIAMAFSKAGMQESAVRFYDEVRLGKRKENLSVFYSTLLFSAVLLAGIATFFLWCVLGVARIKLFGEETQSLIGIVLAMTITGTILTRINNFYRAEQNTKAYNVLNIIRRYLRLTLGIGFLFVFYKSVKSYFGGFLVSEIIIIIVLGYMLIKRKQIKVKSFSWSFFKECFLFGSPLIVNELASLLLKSTDRYLIQFFLGTEAVGIYSAGSDLCLYIKDIIAHPLYFAIVPIYIELWNNKGPQQTKEFLSNVISYYSLIAIPLVFGFTVLAEPIVATVASAKFLESHTLIPFILPGAILWGYYPIVTAGLYIQKQTKKISLLVIIGAGLNICLNLLLIPKMQLVGAALATLITYIVLMIVLIKISFVHLSFQIRIFTLIKITISSIIMFFVLKSITFDSGILWLLLQVLLGVVIFGVAMILIDKEFRENLRKFLHRYSKTS